MSVGLRVGGRVMRRLGNVGVSLWAALWILTGTGSAHPVTYAQTNPGAVMQVATCPAALDASLTLSTGGACFLGGHVRPQTYPAGACGPNPCPAGTGTNAITLTDDTSATVAALWCQNLNGNNACGEATEPRQLFCGAVQIETGPTVQTGPSGDKWRPSLQMWVFVHGVANGNQVVSHPCGATNAWGTKGTADHL